MSDFLIALAFFVGLSGAGIGVLCLHPSLSIQHREDGTREVIRLCAGIFVVMTSLVLGLMVNSAKNTFEGVDKNLHAYATQLILLDRTLRQYGPESEGARNSLSAYVQQAVARMAQSDPILSNRKAESLLRGVADALRGLKPTDEDQGALRQRAEQQFDMVFEMRWALVEQSEGTIPKPLIVLLGAWLILIFASFGYCAPRNAVVIFSLVISSLLIAGAIYLILDMDEPFNGTIQVSSEPLQRVAAELRRQ